MWQPRMVFMATFWGEGAVVCRVMENATGCAVMQEFGLFESWTAANHFANKLNEGVGLSATEARGIAYGAALALAELVGVAVREHPYCFVAGTLERAHVAQLRFLRSSLVLARTFCHLASCCPSEERSIRLLERSRRAFEQGLAYLTRVPANLGEVAEIFTLIKELESELQFCHAAP